METRIYDHFVVPVQESVLDNGLSVVTAQMDSKLASVRIVVRAGSIHEPEPWGIAHYLEHLVYEAPLRELSTEIARDLLMNGADGNAMTGLYITVYELNTHLDDLERCISLMHMMVFSGELTNAAVENERGIILQEVRDRALQNRVQGWRIVRKFPSITRLAARPSGTLKSVGEITLSALTGFREQWYRPNQCAVIVCSSFSHKQVIEFVNQLEFPENSNPANPPIAFAPIAFGRFQQELPMASNQLTFYFQRPDGLEEKRCVNLIAELMSDSVLGLLYRRARKQGQHVYGFEISSDIKPPFGQTRFDCGVEPEHFAFVEEAFFAAIDDLVRGDVPEDLYRMVSGRNRLGRIQREETKAFVTAKSFSDDLVERWENGDLELDLDAMHSIEPTREQIALVAKKIFDRNNFGVIEVVQTS